MEEIHCIQHRGNKKNHANAHCNQITHTHKRKEKVIFVLSGKDKGTKIRKTAALSPEASKARRQWSYDL